MKLVGGRFFGRRPIGRPVGLAITLAVGLTLAACSSSGGTSKASNSPSSTGSTGAASSPTGAASSASGVDFGGKTITLIAPFAVGGAADVFARLVGQELGKFLPGNPTIVVKNMEGGGGSVGLDFVANKSKADGTTLGFFGGGMATRYISKTTGFSALPDQPLVGAFPQGIVLAAVSKVGTDIAKLQKQSSPIKVAETSAGGTGAVTASVAGALLKIPVKQIFGFSGGGSPDLTSMLRGETDATSTADTAYDKTYLPYVQKGQFEGLAQTGIMGDSGKIERSPLVPDVPTIYELYKQVNNGAEPTGEAWQAYQILANLNTANYVMAAPKGTPDNVLQTLRQGFDKMSASDDWKTFTKSKLSVPLATVNSEEGTKAWTSFLGLSDSDIAVYDKYAGIKAKS